MANHLGFWAFTVAVYIGTLKTVHLFLTGRDPAPPPVIYNYKYRNRVMGERHRRRSGSAIASSHHTA